MKRSVSLFLAALMAVSMVALTACGDNGSTTTDSGSGKPGNSQSNPGQSSSTPNQSSTPESSSQDDVEPPIPEVNTLYLVSASSTYKYKVFECKYSSGGPGGTYETDALADYMNSFGWDMGAEEIPADALADILAYDTSAKGPFGDCNVSGMTDENDEFLENSPAVDWVGDNHGLIVATTFEIEDLAAFEEKYSEIFLTFWYDNTPSVYLNGKLVLYKNGELMGGEYADWVDSFMPMDPDDSVFDPLGEDTLMDRLVEGTNTLVIVMKDAWGGRECCFEMAAE